MGEMTLLVQSRYYDNHFGLYFIRPDGAKLLVGIREQAKLRCDPSLSSGHSVSGVLLVRKSFFGKLKKGTITTVLRLNNEMVIHC